ARSNISFILDLSMSRMRAIVPLAIFIAPYSIDD
ncbi:MAG: hypothetical protein ACI906_004430, partial [Candidatus Latescibacterota bacterium]